MARVQPPQPNERGPRADTPSRGRRWWWVAGLGLLLTGCASVPSNTPEAYDDTAADGTVIVEANYMEACLASGEGETECQCYYDGLVDNVEFEDFKEFEDQVEADPTDVPDEYQDIVDDCQGGARTPTTDDEGGDGDDAATTTTRQPS